MDEASRTHFGSRGCQNTDKQVNDKLCGEVDAQRAQDIPQVAEELLPVTVPEQADQPEHNEQDEHCPDGSGEENPERTLVAFNTTRDLAVEHAGIQDAVERHRQDKGQHEQGDPFRQGFPAARITQGKEKRDQGGKRDQQHCNPVADGAGKGEGSHSQGNLFQREGEQGGKERRDHQRQQGQCGQQNPFRDQDPDQRFPFQRDHPV